MHSWLNAVVLVAMFLLAASAGRVAGEFRGRVVAVVLALLGVWWLSLDKTMEGGTLVTLWPGHGIVPADCASLAAFGVAIYAWRARPRG